MNRHVLIPISILSLSQLAFTNCKQRSNSLSEEKFTSKEATLVRIDFEGKIEVDLPVEYKSIRSNILNSEYRGNIDKQLNEQLDYLTGSFLNYKMFNGYPGAVYGKPKITMIDATPLESNPKSAVVRYKYSDNGAFNKALVSSTAVTVPVVLPSRVTEFYERTQAEGKTTCIAGDHSDAEKYWYYWKIDIPECKIKTTDFIETTATLTPLPQTQKTFPWYNETFGTATNGQKKTVKIMLLFGGDFAEDEKGVVDNLVKAGFKETETLNDGSKLYRMSHKGYDVEIEQWVLPGGAQKFKEVAVKGLTKSDIFVYAGHSNYGGYFDPAVLGLTKESFDQNKPQYFYFGGCRSFRYYNAKFFDLKPQKLNIVTTSVPSYGMTFPYALPAFILGMTDERRFSWQEIITQMQAAETESLTVNKPKGYKDAYVTWPKFKALLSVNGDEKNPTSGQ